MFNTKDYRGGSRWFLSRGIRIARRVSQDHRSMINAFPVGSYEHDKMYYLMRQMCMVLRNHKRGYRRTLRV